MSAGGEIPWPVRKNQNDFSDALRKRGIEEVNEHQPYGCIGEWSERIAVA